MKRYLLYIFSVAAAVTLPYGCRQDDPAQEAIHPQGSFVTLTVTDSGYIPADGGMHSRTGGNNYTAILQTRASESDYTTGFIPGDKIGVFAKKGGRIITEVNNLCLTATAGSQGGIIWKDADGNPLLRFSGVAYTAYYPYRQELTDMPTAESWVLSTDQSDYTKYTAQDLMTATDTPSGNDLTFNMQHQMALVVMNLPKTKYTFNNVSPAIPDYSIDAPHTQLNGFSPLRMSDGTDRYLVNPSTNGKLSGSYTPTGGQTVEWSFTAIVNAHNYQVFTVDGGQKQKFHTLQPGDFYMEDGQLVGKDETLTKAQQAACTGIVFCVDNEFTMNYKGVGMEGGYIHGLVVALKDADGGSGIPWEDNAAFLAASNYNASVPRSSSGWHLPSKEELEYICWGKNLTQSSDGKDMLEKQFKKISGAAPFQRLFYWSSTVPHTSDAWFVSFGDNHEGHVSRRNPHRVRAILAF